MTILSRAARLLPGLVPPLPGGDEEAREYAFREAASPEVQEFVGGHGLATVIVAVAILLVLVYLLFKKENT